MGLKPRLCVDFDGTIFDGSQIIDGCIEALTELRRTHSIAIFSARPTDAERQHMKSVLDQSGVPYDEILAAKPEAVRYVDDKGLHFRNWKDVLAELQA